MSELYHIVIRAPADATAQTATLASIQWLLQSFENCRIQIIVNEGEDRLYRFISEIEKIHLIPEEKDTVLNIFQWAHKAKELFNIDYYFDFRGDNSAATFGIALKAKTRIGYASLFTKPMFNKSLPIEQKHQFLDEHFLALCELVLEKEIPENICGQVARANETELTQLNSIGPFIFLAIRASEWNRHQDIWQSWIKELNEETLVVTIDQDVDDISALEWLSAHKNDQLLLLEKPTHRTLLVLLRYARGILSDSKVFANLAHYYGLHSAILAFDLEDYPSFATFSPRPQIFLEREKMINTWISSSGERLIVDKDEATELLLKAFRL